MKIWCKNKPKLHNCIYYLINSDTFFTHQYEYAIIYHISLQYFTIYSSFVLTATERFINICYPFFHRRYILYIYLIILKRTMCSSKSRMKKEEESCLILVFILFHTYKTLKSWIANSIELLKQKRTKDCTKDFESLAILRCKMNF